MSVSMTIPLFRKVFAGIGEGRAATVEAVGVVYVLAAGL